MYQNKASRHSYFVSKNKMLQGFFVPRFEEVYKDTLEKSQKINNEKEIYPAEWLVKNKIKKEAENE